jgi:hypothetical protein
MNTFKTLLLFFGIMTWMTAALALENSCAEMKGSYTCKRLDKNADPYKLLVDTYSEKDSFGKEFPGFIFSKWDYSYSDKQYTWIRMAKVLLDGKNTVESVDDKGAVYTEGECTTERLEIRRFMLVYAVDFRLKTIYGIETDPANPKNKKLLISWLRKNDGGGDWYPTVPNEVYDCEKK